MSLNETVSIVDRSEMIQTMRDKLNLDPKNTAIVTVDMHRGHLDPAVATMPANPEDSPRVIKNAKEVLDLSRDKNIPIIHVILRFRKLPDLGSEGMSVPFWKALHDVSDEKNRLSPGRNSTVNDHNIIGSPGCEIIPELLNEQDYVIDNKKRLDCYYGTDLKTLLDNLNVKNVCLMGINTNTCVLNTAFTSFNHNLAPVVLSDCCASMYGDDLHALGLQNVARCLGWVLTNEEFKEKVKA